MTGKILVFILIIAFQAFFVLFLMKSGFLNTFRMTSSTFRDIWKMWRNESSSVEHEAEMHGFVDLEHNDFSWLKITRNVSDIPTFLPITTTRSPTVKTVNTAEDNDEENGVVLEPTVNHKAGEIYLIILVTTIPSAVDKRNFIRKSWGTIHERSIAENDTESNNAMRAVYVFFMLGRTRNESENQAIDDEASEYGDILCTSEQETYRNIVLKVWISFEWVLKYKPKYLIKADDDVYLHLPRFFWWIKNVHLPSRLYAGNVHYRAYIARNPKNEHYVSKAEYRGRFFPDYCAGPCYVLSGNILHQLVKISKELKKFRVEDAYLGLVAKTASVKPYDAGGRIFVWSRSLNKAMKKWTDERLAIAICIGDSLKLETMKYIHERYLNIDG